MVLSKFQRMKDVETAVLEAFSPVSQDLLWYIFVFPLHSSYMHIAAPLNTLLNLKTSLFSVCSPALLRVGKIM